MPPSSTRFAKRENSPPFPKNEGAATHRGRALPGRPARYAFPILNILVLHTGQLPSVAGLPFFIVIGLGAFISRFVRHFKQYASIR